MILQNEENHESTAGMGAPGRNDTVIKESSMFRVNLALASVTF